MEIITQNYEKILENLILDKFSKIIKEKVNPNQNKVFNYIRILDTLDERICDIAKESLTTIIETIDRGYKNSPERRHRYHIKAKSTRTIMTVFGEITYKKTIYSYKYGYKSYCFIDDYLGLKKYDYFDPYIKALIVDYSSKHSYSKVATIINDMIGNRVKLKEEYQYITKQTIRNIILNPVLSNPELKEKDTPENLYVMADEKFIATQNNNNENVMVKEIIVFDGRETKNGRTSLTNKHIFASFDRSPAINCLDYLFNTYDLDKVKNIYVMGDGAKWIKNLTPEFITNTSCNVTFNLDKFHFKQAIHHIGLNDNIENILTEYVLTNNKKLFVTCCDELIKEFPHREETIILKRDYIISNWKYILNLYYNKLKCPMESQISHTLADLFTSRPKAYSKKMLSKLINLRLLYKNKYNIKMLFLNNFNKKEVLTLNQEFLNYDIYNKSTYQFNQSLIPTNYHPGFYPDYSHVPVQNCCSNFKFKF